MENALLLLPDWLAVGLAVLVFYGIGLLMAKWIWGRHAMRLSLAADENMLLLSQWSDLGETQNLLFRKLRTRWQSDRDAWDEQAASWAEQLSRKDKSIRKLIAEIKNLKESRAAEAQSDGPKIKELSGEIHSLQRELNDKNSEIQDVVAELNDVRKGYLAKREKIENLECALDQSANTLHDVEAVNTQLEALLARRAMEITHFREATPPSEKADGDASHQSEDRAATTPLLDEPSPETEGELDASSVEDLPASAAVSNPDHHEQSGNQQVAMLNGQIEELESIVDDRNQEIEDAASELKEQIRVISKLRSRVAELEGELDGQNVETVDLAQELEEKNEQIAFLTNRISEVEEALADQYRDVNKVRSYWSQIENHAAELDAQSEKLSGELGEKTSEAEQLAADLERSVSELEPLRTRVDEVEEQLEAAQSQVEKLEEELGEKSLSLAVAEESRVELKKELQEREDSLELADNELNSLKLELQERDRSAEKMKAEWQDATTKLDEYDQNLAIRDENILKFEETVNRIETEADSLKILLDEGKRNTADLESKIQDFEELVLSKDSEIGIFTREIRNLVESVESPSGKDDGNTGNTGSDGSRSIDSLFSEALDSDDSPSQIHIRVLGQTISNLQNRLIEAEGNYGVCEREKALVTERTRSLKAQYEMDLMTRDKQIQILKEEVSCQQKKLEELRSDQQGSGRAVAVATSEEPLAAAEFSRLNQIEEAPGFARQSEPAEGERTVPKQGIHLDVHFDERSCDLKASEIAKIDEALKSVRGKGVPCEVSVDGYSGNEGSADFNESLSARRADAVRELLIENGLRQSGISVQGRGEHPRHTGEVDAWKARSVEVAFVTKPAVEAMS